MINAHIHADATKRLAELLSKARAIDDAHPLASIIPTATIKAWADTVEASDTIIVDETDAMTVGCIKAIAGNHNDMRPVRTAIIEQMLADDLVSWPRSQKGNIGSLKGVARVADNDKGKAQFTQAGAQRDDLLALGRLRAAVIMANAGDAVRGNPSAVRAAIHMGEIALSADATGPLSDAMRALLGRVLVPGAGVTSDDVSAARELVSQRDEAGAFASTLETVDVSPHALTWIAHLYLQETTTERLAWHAANTIAAKHKRGDDGDAVGRLRAVTFEHLQALGGSVEVGSLRARLHGIGKHGIEVAATIDETTLQTPIGCVLTLAECLWVDVVASELAVMKLPYATLSTHITAIARGKMIGRPRSRDKFDGVTEFVDEDDKVKATVRTPLEVSNRIARGQTQAGFGSLVSHLARQTLWQAQAGFSDPHFVEVPISKHQLRATLGITIEALKELLDEGMEWLYKTGPQMGGKGFPLINGYETYQRAPSSKKGGQGVEVFRIDVGLPLRAYGVARLNADAGIPFDSEWFVPAFAPMRFTPVSGSYTVTWTRQRDGVACGLGSYIALEHRSEYALHGGFTPNPNAWADYIAPTFNLYNTAAASLPRKMWESLFEAPADAIERSSAPLFAYGESLERTPFLVPLNDGSGRVRFGDEFEGAEAVIIGAGNFSARRAAARAKQHANGLQRARTVKRKGKPT